MDSVLNRDNETFLCIIVVSGPVNSWFEVMLRAILLTTRVSVCMSRLGAVRRAWRGEIETTRP